MAVNGFDFTELDEFNTELVRLARVQFPKETKAFLRREANKVNRIARKGYKSETKKKTGNLLKGLTHGKPYIYNGDEYQIRAKNTAPHAYLIEHGHGMIKTRPGNPDSKIPIGATVILSTNAQGQEIHAGNINIRNRFVEGKHIMGRADNKFKSTFPQDVEVYIDDLLEKGLR